jgi:hypothetical protein
VAVFLMLGIGASCMRLPPAETARTAAICEASAQGRAAHAGALLEDGGPKSVETGADLLGDFQRACA